MCNKVCRIDVIVFLCFFYEFRDSEISLAPLVLGLVSGKAVIGAEEISLWSNGWIVGVIFYITIVADLIIRASAVSINDTIVGIDTQRAFALVQKFFKVCQCSAFS